MAHPRPWYVLRVLTRTNRAPGSLGRAVARQARAAGYLIVGLPVGVAALLLLVIMIVVLLLCIVGVGLLLGPIDQVVRRWCDQERRRVGRLMRRPSDTGHETDALLATARARAVSGDLARDALLLALRVVVGIPLGIVPVVLPLFAVNHALLPFYWWALPEGEDGGVIAVSSWPGALGVGLLGLAALVVWLGAPVIARLDAGRAAALLAPSAAQVQRRRAEAEKMRRESAVSAHSAELRRIERDLHDAAQNRLVAVAMYVGMARRQVQSGSGDPDPALAKAGQAATDAIAEVRRVIQGIYPPVLAEEGLVPAIGFLVDQSQVPARLIVDRPAPTPAAVDAAIYFSVAELLTNIAKHSQARESTVELRWRQYENESTVGVVISDDGRGGVDRSRGSGIAGVDSRISALGGSLEVTSPQGGPTRIEVNLPCEW